MIVELNIWQTNMANHKPKGFWNKENCLKFASLCKSRSEFKKLYGQAWKVCRNNGWIDEVCSHMIQRSVPQGYWQNYDHCYMVAKQCITASEFEKKYPQAYRVARTKKWNKDYLWFVSGFDLAWQRREKWSYDACAEESKKYNTRSEFQKGAVGAYQKALKKGWIDDYVWLNRSPNIYGASDCVYKYEFKQYNTVYVGRTVNRGDRNYAHIFNIHKDSVAKFAFEHNIPVPEMEILAENIGIEEGLCLEDSWIKYYIEQGYNVLNKAKTGIQKGSIGSIGWGKWTYKTCYNEARKYTSRKEFQIKNVGAYTRALQYKWLDDYDWFKIPKSGQVRWTQDRCHKEAKRYTTIKEFRALSRTAYEKSRTNGWLKEYIWLLNEPPVRRVSHWTQERCREEAKKYKTRTEFQYAKGAGQAYRVALKNGWIEEYDWMVPLCKPNSYWNNYERCYEEAKKYKTRSEFQYAKGASRAYKYSVKNGWIDRFTWMLPKSKKPGYWTKEQCIIESKKYSKRGEFKKGSPSAYAIALRNGWYKEFIWLEPAKTYKRQ